MKEPTVNGRIYGKKNMQNGYIYGGKYAQNGRIYGGKYAPNVSVQGRNYLQNSCINYGKKGFRNGRRRHNAYFTVEAACIFPVALGTVFFIVYMLLFQYNRCLMEQDLGALALWGSRVEAEGSEELHALIQKRTNEIYRDKYAAWEMLTLDVRLEHNQFAATGKGQLALPVTNIQFWDRNSPWEAEAYYRFWRISPVDFVRLCNRIKAWRETATG